MIFFGLKQDGVLTWNDREKMAQYIKRLPKDCKVKMEIKQYRKPRSIKQNALYWAWLNLISESTGYLPEELHASFRSMFLTDRTKKIPLVRSTTALNTEQFTQYLDKIEKIAVDLEIRLPTPDEYYREIEF